MSEDWKKNISRSSGVDNRLCYSCRSKWCCWDCCWIFEVTSKRLFSSPTASCRQYSSPTMSSVRLNKWRITNSISIRDSTSRSLRMAHHQLLLRHTCTRTTQVHSCTDCTVLFSTTFWHLICINLLLCKLLKFLMPRLGRALMPRASPPPSPSKLTLDLHAAWLNNLYWI